MEFAIYGDEQDGASWPRRVTGTMPARAKHSASLSTATSTGPSLPRHFGSWWGVFLKRNITVR